MREAGILPSAPFTGLAAQRCRPALAGRVCGPLPIPVQPPSGGFSAFGLSRFLWLKPNREKPPEGG
jgi:hypothetical protein